MTWSPYSRLMHQVCVGLGWCGSVVDGQRRYVHHYYPPLGPVTADQFVAWVFSADNYDPASNPALTARASQELRAAFIHHLGAEVVDVKQLA